MTGHGAAATLYGRIARERNLSLLAADRLVAKQAKYAWLLLAGVPGNNGELAWATFKNISLVRGEDQGFEMMEGKAGE